MNPQSRTHHERLQEVAFKLVHHNRTDNDRQRWKPTVGHQSDEGGEDRADQRTHDRDEAADEHDDRQREPQLHTEDEHHQGDACRIDRCNHRGATHITAECVTGTHRSRMPRRLSRLRNPRVKERPDLVAITQEDRDRDNERTHARKEHARRRQPGGRARAEGRARQELLDLLDPFIHLARADLDAHLVRHLTRLVEALHRVIN